MAYTDISVGKNGRKPDAGPTGNLKGKPFDKTKNSGGSNKNVKSGGKVKK
jgi:hypothetical protein